MTYTTPHGSHFEFKEEFLNGDDIGRLAVVIDAMRGFVQPIAQIEPEPTEVKKRKFRKDKPVSSGYSCGLSMGMGKKPDPNEPLYCVVMFEVPSTRQPLTAERARAAWLGAGLELAADWEMDMPFGDHAINVAMLDIRPFTSTFLATYLLHGLRALGAQTPSDRWKCHWTTPKGSPIPD